MLTKMERRGLVDHSRDGRRYVYRPRVSRKTVRRSMVGELTDRLFAGDPAELVAHLLREHEIDASELEELTRRVDAAPSPPDDEE
jgi:predicted transcriptional regulator